MHFVFSKTVFQFSLSCFILLCFGDTSVGRFPLQFNVPRNSSKLWFSHIQLFLQNVHKSVTNLALQKYLQASLQMWQLFVQTALGTVFHAKKNQSLCIINTKKKMKRCVAKFSWIHDQCNQEVNEAQKKIVSPTGRLESIHSDFFPCKEREFYCYDPRGNATCCHQSIRIRKKYVYHWIFTLDIRLSLNLTIHKSMFPLTHQCISGKVGVAALSQNGNITFCGQHTNLQIYPEHRHHQISLTIHRCRMFEFNASFMVFDRGLVSSLNREADILVSLDVTTSIPSNLAKEILCQLKFGSLTHEGSLIYIWLLQSLKLHRIVLHSRLAGSEHTVVFDGPEMSCKNVMQHINGSFLCSTFQCLIFVKNKVFQKKMQIHFVSTAHSNFVDLLHFQNKTKIYFPTDGCAESLCVLHRKATQQFQVNVTVTTMVYQGQGYSCSYGGFVTAEMSDTAYRESTTICENHDGSVSQSQSFYSQNSSLSIILFWYNNLAKVRMSFSLGETKCFIVWTNLCLKFKREQIFDSDHIQLSHTDPMVPMAIRRISFGIPQEREIDECLLLNYFASSISEDPEIFYECQNVLTYASAFLDREAILTMKGSLVEHKYFNNLIQCDHGCDRLHRIHQMEVLWKFDEFCSLYAQQGNKCKRTGESTYQHWKFILGKRKTCINVHYFILSTKSLHGTSGKYRYTFYLRTHMWKTPKPGYRCKSRPWSTQGIPLLSLLSHLEISW